MPIENDPGFWKWLVGSIVGGGTAVFSYHKWIESKIAKKADKSEVDADFSSVHVELRTQRGTLAKVFDQIRENEQRAQDRHERLMDKLGR